MDNRYHQRIRQRALESAEAERPPQRDWKPLKIACSVIAVALLIALFVSRVMPRNEPEHKPSAVEPEGVVGGELIQVAIERLAADFLEAETVEEMLELVDHPAETEPRMRDFFAEGSGNRLPLGGYLAGGFGTLPREGEKIYKISILETFASWTALFAKIDSQGAPKILWEESVGWMDPSWEDVVESMPEEPVTVRVFGALDDYYNYMYSDEEEWVCMRLGGRWGKTSCYAYAKRSELDEPMFQTLQLATFPLILELKFVPGTEKNQAEITEVIVIGWLDGLDAPAGADGGESKPLLQPVE